MAKLPGLWEADGMKKPELTDVGWLGPRDEMDRASHRFGKCSECHETICVEKAVTDGPSIGHETNETLYEAVRAYELYEQRGKGHGFALQDWLEAEAEVLARFFNPLR
jgi:Protein of unknown function (DUF2934)